MNRLTHLVRNGLAAAALIGATLGITSHASAAPSGLNCPSQLRITFITTCYYRANPYETVSVRTSNSAVYVVTNPWTDGSGSGNFSIQGQELGGVTICLYSTNGAYRTCDFVEVVR